MRIPFACCEGGVGDAAGVGSAAGEGSVAGVGTGVASGVGVDGGGFTGAGEGVGFGLLVVVLEGAVSPPAALRTAARKLSAPLGICTDPVRMVLKSIMRP